ncbi:MAG: universal stress protein [Acidobacteria bacterium]|nr:universal stress protein [Acidobacteriota bacterium]
MRKAKKILLAVDGSEFSLAAVEEAARRPWPEGSVVKIVSVAEMPVPVAPWAMPIPSASFSEWDRIFEECAIERITQAMAKFGEIAGSHTEVTAKTLEGDPKTAILDEAERWGADLIILGTHGYNALERLWLGSVSRAVVSHAKCSVEIVRRRKLQDTGRQGLKILLAVDGSESADAAVEEIAGRPWPRGSVVNVISIVHLPFTPTPEIWALPESYYFQLEKAERKHAGSAITRAFSRLRESNSEREIPLTLINDIILGHEEEKIIEAAKEWGADLVVLGSHGKRGYERFLLGSVSQAVAHHAPCSVEIVRRKSAD